MIPGAKRTLVARLMAGFGCICGLLGFLIPPTAQFGGPPDFNWFAGGTVSIVFAVYLLLDGAVAFQKTRP